MDDQVLRLEILKLVLGLDYLAPKEIVEIATQLYEWVYGGQ